MKKIRKLLFIALLGFIFTTSFGQMNYHAYKKFNYTWETTSPKKIPVDPLFKNEDVVLLDDRHIVSIGGSMGSTTNLIFQRKARLKFLTKEGIATYNKIVIPESLDPLYDYHSIPFKNSTIKKGPAYFDLSLMWFAARVIKADGRIIQGSSN